jgi:hypothetical protein
LPAKRELVGASLILDFEAETPKGKEGFEIVNDVEGLNFPGPDDVVPEADAAEQHQAVESDFDVDDTGLDIAYLNADATDRDANEADVIEQAFIVPGADDYWDDDR